MSSEPLEVETCICILEVVICSSKAPCGGVVSAQEKAEAGTCSDREERLVYGIPWW